MFNTQRNAKRTERTLLDIFRTLIFLSVNWLSGAGATTSQASKVGDSWQNWRDLSDRELACLGSV